MRNYSQNIQPQTSREFYNSVLKNNTNNLNSSKRNSNSLDVYLDQFLEKSYKTLSPIFNDNQQYKNFQKESISNHTDKEFDEKIDNYSPKWLKLIINLLLSVYHKIISKKIKRFIKKVRLLHFQKIINHQNSTPMICMEIFQKKASP